MAKFGSKSKERLATCDEKLQKVFQEVIKYVDCSILEEFGYIKPNITLASSQTKRSAFIFSKPSIK